MIHKGAKLISPFGLFGQCGSREFRRRIREEYYNTSTEEGLETIQVGKFLRDFVIEFGPADLDPESRPSQRLTSLSPKILAVDEGMASVHM